MADETRKPRDVAERIAQAASRLMLVTWSRPTPSGPIEVSFIPSDDPSVRARQEEDLARHLEERTPKR